MQGKLVKDLNLGPIRGDPPQDPAAHQALPHPQEPGAPPGPQEPQALPAPQDLELQLFGPSSPDAAEAEAVEVSASVWACIIGIGQQIGQHLRLTAQSDMIRRCSSG